jgi:hypothetical protein
MSCFPVARQRITTACCSTPRMSAAFKGWIVDLRGNTGGNMWPMLTGIGPILGDGPAGSFVAADGNVTWFYQDGKTGTRNPGGVETVSLTLDEEPALRTSSPAPVAVLVDSSTASSAEAITIAFHGRPDTRFFGTHTAGKSTAVQPFKLDDGAELYLTTAIDADRSGKSYPDGFTPDQIVSVSGSSMPQENNDVVIQAAQTWLVAGTAPVAPPAPVTKTKGRRKKAVATQIAATTATQPSSTPAIASTPTPVVAVVTPAALVASPAAAVVAPAPAVASAPAPAAASAPTTPLATADTQVAAAAAAPVTPKPKPVHKKVVVHQGS